jgi:peptidoglycan/LPS O-acetylase OafA/YrhL
LSGGFTGVDVFFVISGFLITSKLRDDIAAGTFSILGFYDRRIRWILPALLVMLTMVLFAGKALLMPGDYKSLSTSTAAAAFGVSNFYFFSNTGYFDQAADLLPQLHTWSLAVEEQFYFVWPIVLFVIAKSRKNVDMAAILGGIAILGFAASLMWFNADPKTAFFMAAPRAWELAIGALLVFLPTLPRSLGEAATAIGLVLIGIGFVTVSASSFPGTAALYPCIGAALVIWPRHEPTRTGSWLSVLRPMGLISYSLYLWHWPVWVLFRVYINNGQPRMREALALALISVVLAVLSYFLVERPFRKRRWQPAQSVKVGLVACALIFCGSMYVHSTEGMSDRLPPNYHAMQSLDVMWDWPCPTMADPLGVGSRCVFGSDWETAKIKGVLWGDSYAMVFAPLMEQASKDHHASMMLSQQCRPVVDNDIVRIRYDGPQSRMDDCAKDRSKMIKALKGSPDIKLVVIAASWANMTSMIYSDVSKDSGARLIETAMEKIVGEITMPGRQIVLVTAVPNWGTRDPLPCEVAEVSGLLRRPCSAAQRVITKESFEKQRDTVAVLDRIAARHPNTRVIHAGDNLCRSGECITRLNGEPLYRDASHIRRNLTDSTKQQLGRIIGLDQAFSGEPASN